MPAKNDVPSVFVRNLPLEYTGDALSTLFSQIAPVKHAFIVRDRASKASKGYGFVQFALEEDASNAAEKMDGTHVDGNALAVVVAKGIKPESAAAKRKAAKPAPKPVPKPTHKRGPDGEIEMIPPTEDAPAAEAAVVPLVSGMKRKRAPEAATTETGAEAAKVAVKAEAAKSADKKAEKPEGKDAKEDKKKKPAKSELKIAAYAPLGTNAAEQTRRLAIFGLPEDFDSKRLWKRIRKIPGARGVAWPFLLFGSQTLRVAIVEFTNKTTRDAAVPKLDTHVLQGHQLSVRLGENVVTGKDAQAKSRLIVRNLMFSATVEDIAVAFARNGASRLITHINVPPSAPRDTGDEAPRNRGFAFVEFATHDDAATSLAAMNGNKINKREVAVDWSVPQEAYKSGVVVPPVVEAAAGAGKSEEEEDVEVPIEDPKEDETPADEDEDDDEEEDDGDDDDEDDDDEDDDDDDEDEDDEDSSEEEGGEESGDDKTTPTDAVEAGTTLFIRNLPFDATDATLFEVMRKYGAVRYARVVMEKETGRSKGTAFVQYYKKASADRAMVAANGEEVSSPLPANTNDPRARKQALAKAAMTATLSAGGISMSGRTLLVTRAVTREEAADIVVKEGSKKYDKRHLYLQYEGAIRPDSDAAEHMPKTDLVKRENAIKEKKTKLQSPLFFVSPVRLSIRNLAKHIDDATLKSLGKDAAVAGFKNELVRLDEGDPSLLPKKASFKTDKPRLLKAKIIRESLPTDVRDGKNARVRLEADGKTPQSKGYGFLEFKEHLHALAALRQLNNNPAYSKYAAGGGATSKKPEERPRLIVEFTVENWREVKKQEDKRVRQRERAKVNAAAGVGIAQPKISDTASTRTDKTGKSAAAKESTGRKVSFDPAIIKGKSTKKDSKPAKTAPEAAVSGKKRGRTDMSKSQLDPELDELAALADSGDAKKPRRAAKKREKAEEADHDRMVNDYKKKLFKAPAAAGKGPSIGAGAAADLSKWME